MFQFGGIEALFGGLGPQNPPVATGLGRSRKFWKSRIFYLQILTSDILQQVSRGYLSS